jgi:hypothetical protein
MTQESQERDNANMAGVDAALLVFYLTALAYIAAFSYQAGYLSHFGLWVDLVEVDLKQLLIAFGVMSALIGSVWIGGDAATHMWSQLQAKRVWGRLLARVITVSFIIFAAWLNEQHWYFTLAILFPVLVNVFFQFIAPIFVRVGGTYTQRVESWIEHGDELEGKGLRAAFSRFGPVVNVVFNAILILVIASLLGQLVARFQDVFLVSVNEPACIVIRTGPTAFLCQAFDRSSHVLTPRYRLISEKDADFTAERLGRFSKTLPIASSARAAQTPITGVLATPGAAGAGKAPATTHLSGSSSPTAPPPAPSPTGVPLK